MIRPRSARTRSGITLTEILISILIMGVGVISIATLFPLGLLRLRNAQRLTRGAYLVESAIADLGARDLLTQLSFKNTGVSPWYQTTPSGQFYPWLQDTPAYGSDWSGGASRSVIPGLPVAYDPLWRAVTGLYPDPLAGKTPECRFGSGIGLLRDDPNPGTPAVTTPSAHGVQRLSNLQSFLSATTSPLSGNIMLGNVSDAQFLQNNLSVLQTFVSPEDVVLQEAKGIYPDPVSGNQLNSPSPVVPALTGGSYDNDWRFTWFFTGTLASADGTIFEGEIVICESRPFGMDQTTTSGSQYKVSGETVVEAVWGYTSAPAVSGATAGYGGTASQRSVLLRWNANQPDPDVKVGGWICDVTYERNQSVASTRFPNQYQPQRCEWYQIAKRTEPDADPGFTDDPKGVSFRRMTVWTTTPLKAQSLLNFTTTPAQPYHVEAALIMPSVINVYPRTVYSR